MKPPQDQFVLNRLMAKDGFLSPDQGMKKLFQRLLVAGIFFLVAISPLHLRANPPITGGISYSGEVAFDGSIGTATAFTSFSPVFAGQSSGSESYTNIPDSTAVHFAPFVFNPPPAAPFQTWVFTNSGAIYSFDTFSVTVAFQDSRFLFLQGRGLARISGFADTPSQWVMNTLSGGSFSYSMIADSIPQLKIAPATNNSAIISWSEHPVGFVLQQCSSLGSTNWIDSTNMVTVVGTNNQVVAPVLSENVFYRLLYR